MAAGQRIEFWTRTISNDTSQIFCFRVTVDDDWEIGHFTLDDASCAYAFNIHAITLRFEVVSSNGGNTGAVVAAVYGTPITR